MYGRRWNGRTAQVAAERGPLGPGGPRLVLTHLHIVILKQKDNYLQDIIFAKPEKKACNIVLSQDPTYPENKSLDKPPEIISIKEQIPTMICNKHQQPHTMDIVEALVKLKLPCVSDAFQFCSVDADHQKVQQKRHRHQRQRRSRRMRTRHWLSHQRQRKGRPLPPPQSRQRLPWPRHQLPPQPCKGTKNN